MERLGIKDHGLRFHLVCVFVWRNGARAGFCEFRSNFAIRPGATSFDAESVA
jgi:hypothetical protein